MPLELWITTSFQRVLFILRVPVCQRCSTIQRFGTNGIDGSGTVWKCSSDAKVSKHCKNCWGWNIWSYMHFCWIAAALLENIILHWAYGCLGNMIPMPLGVLDLRLTDGGLPCIRRLRTSQRSSPPRQCVLEGVPCVWCPFQLWRQISQSPDTQPHVWVHPLSES